MSTVTLQIGGRSYDVVCEDGEEPRLLRLGSMLDEKASQASAMTKGLTESRLLLFAALLMADELTSDDGKTDQAVSSAAHDNALATQLESLATRAESLADILGGTKMQNANSTTTS